MIDIPSYFRIWCWFRWNICVESAKIFIRAVLLTPRSLKCTVPFIKKNWSLLISKLFCPYFCFVFLPNLHSHDRIILTKFSIYLEYRTTKVCNIKLMTSQQVENILHFPRQFSVWLSAVQTALRHRTVFGTPKKYLFQNHTSSDWTMQSDMQCYFPWHHLILKAHALLVAIKVFFSNLVKFLLFVWLTCMVKQAF